MEQNYANYYGYQAGYPGGYYTGATMFNQMPELKMTQGVGPEELKAMRKTGGFSLDISQEELWRAYCTHRLENKFMVTQDDEGSFICSLCGSKFNAFNGDVNDARELVKKVKDLLETTKMQCLTLPSQTIQNVFQIEPVLDRIPALFEQSVNDFKRATNVGSYAYGQENNGFNMYQNMINPMAGNGYYDPAMAMNQPVYGAQPMQPMMQQPMYGQPMGMPQQPMYGTQPMMQQPYGQPMMQPQGNPFNVNSAPVQGQPQPTATSTPSDTVTVNKTLTD